MMIVRQVHRYMEDIMCCDDAVHRPAFGGAKQVITILRNTEEAPGLYCITRQL